MSAIALTARRYNGENDFCKALIDLKAKKEGEKKMEDIMAVSATLEDFMVSDDFKQGVILATKASLDGSGYSVELYPEDAYPRESHGTKWGVVCNDRIGNLYEPEGIMLDLTPLDTTYMAEYVNNGTGDVNDFLLEGFYLVEDELKKEMREKLNSYKIA